MKKTLNMIAFDLGASNGRAILGCFDGDKIKTEELSRFENNYVEVNNISYWSIHNIFQQMKFGLSEYSKKGLGELSSFGIDSWGVDFGLLDKNGNLIGTPRAYRNGTEEDIAAVHEKVPFNTLFDRTGIASMSFNTLYQLYRRKREGDPALENAKTLLLTPDLLGYFFTGEKGSEYTMASTTMMYNPSKKNWDYETLKELGLPAEILTEVEPSGTVRGALKSKIAEELNINAAKLVAVGTHDTASAVAAIPGKGSFAFCSSGTWSLIGVETEKAIMESSVRDSGFSNEGTVQGGFRPLRNIMGLWIIQECRRDWQKLGKNLSWNEIAEAAANAAPLRSIINPDSPEFFTAGNMEKKIKAFCERTGQKVPETVGEVARCVYESLALKYRNAVEELEKIKGEKINSLNIVGGGCQNRLLNQMAADATGRSVTTGPIEGAAIGNLLVQAQALGEIGGMDELREVVARSEAVNIYEAKPTAAWEEAYGKLLGYMEGKE